MKVNRRDFNKSIGTIFGMALFPSVPNLSATTINPGHYGITALRSTTTFNFEQIFDAGRLDVYENIQHPSKTELNFRFWLDKKQIHEHSVSMVGAEKKWEVLESKRSNRSDKCELGDIEVFETSIEQGPFFENGMIETIRSNNIDRKTFSGDRVPLDKIKLWRTYDVKVSIFSDVKSHQILLSGYYVQRDFTDYGVGAF